MLLRWLDREMKRYLNQVLGEAVVAVAHEAIQTMLTALKEAVLKVLRIIAIVLLAIAIVVVFVLAVIATLDLVPGDEVVAWGGFAGLLKLMQSLVTAL